MGQARPLQMPLVKFLLPEVVAKCLLGSEVTSADAGNGPDKTSTNAVREISFQCKKGLSLIYFFVWTIKRPDFRRYLMIFMLKNFIF
jgi:hypothetical protein